MVDDCLTNCYIIVVVLSLGVLTVLLIVCFGSMWSHLSWEIASSLLPLGANFPSSSRADMAGD